MEGKTNVTIGDLVVTNSTITKEQSRKIQAFCEALERETGNYVGVRFEELERKVGDICERSKHNPDRDDERDFPAYGSDEYDSLPTLDGTSTWDWGISFEGKYYDDMHCYIVMGEDFGSHDDPDAYERVLISPVVVVKLF